MDAGIARRIQSFRQRDRQQLRLLNEADGWHEQIQTKLSGLCELKQFTNFARCGKELTYRTCKGCGDVRTFHYHCMLKWCPRCSWRIVRIRQIIISRWAELLEQPKHLVTTQRNTSTLTHRQLRNHTRNLSKLRRTKVFEHVTGGCVSVEVTNESKGWHLHAHWLVNARWVDAKELAVTWGTLVGQDYAIVKVLDLRERKGYAREVSKYVCKGSAMAKWPPDEINEFVHAIRGQRFFFTFGDLFRKGGAIRAAIHAEKEPSLCECGCGKFIIRSELDQKIWARRGSSSDLPGPTKGHKEWKHHRKLDPHRNQNILEL